MDYSTFKNFPFPEKISPDEEQLKSYFFSCPDDRQLQLLNGCKSYGDFRQKLQSELSCN